VTLTPDGRPDPLDAAQQQAIVDFSYATGGAHGGAFDGPAYGTRRSYLGIGRPHSAAIARLRFTSLTVAIVFAALGLASPIVLGLTVGTIPIVTVALFAVALAAFVAFVASYRAERSEILRRTAREYAEQRATRATPSGRA
jgi:hypothetical protein